MHYHNKSKEIFYVLSGKVRVLVGGLMEFFESGDCFDIDVGLIHTIEAYEDSELVEVSTGVFDEKDIIQAAFRLEEGK